MFSVHQIIVEILMPILMNYDKNCIMFHLPEYCGFSPIFLIILLPNLTGILDHFTQVFFVECPSFDEQFNFSPTIFYLKCK